MPHDATVAVPTAISDRDAHLDRAADAEVVVTAIDAEARAVIGEFVTGRISENAMINWFGVARWSDDSEETNDGVEAFTRIVLGESTPRRERERLSVDYFGPDAAVWHTNNDFDEQEDR